MIRTLFDPTSWDIATMKVIYVMVCVLLLFAHVSYSAYGATVQKEGRCTLFLDQCGGLLKYCNDPATCLTDFTKTKVFTPAGNVQFECHVQLPSNCTLTQKALILEDFTCVIGLLDGSSVNATAVHATVTPSGRVSYECQYKP